MTELFGDYPEISLASQVTDVFDVLRAQTGLTKEELIKVTMNVGIVAVLALVESGAQQNVEPILDIAIRQGSETLSDIDELPVITRTVQNLSFLVEVVRNEE
jgi:hypothetical protein